MPEFLRGVFEDGNGGKGYSFLLYGQQTHYLRNGRLENMGRFAVYLVGI